MRMLGRLIESKSSTLEVELLEEVTVFNKRPISMPLKTVQYDEKFYTVQPDGKMRLLDTGLYEISYSMNSEQFGQKAASNESVYFRMECNSIEIKKARAYSYLREKTEPYATATVSFFITITELDSIIELFCMRSTSQNVVVVLADGSNLTIKRIRPL